MMWLFIHVATEHFLPPYPMDVVSTSIDQNDRATGSFYSTVYLHGSSEPLV